MNLRINLLGGFQVETPDLEVQGFESDKARGLLAYLAVNCDRPHRREFLAGLLWPDYPEWRARRNLSQTLYSLRRTLDRASRGTEAMLGSSLITADNQTVQLAAGEDRWIDVVEIRAGLEGCPDHHPAAQTTCEACRRGQETAVGLYRGELLAGLFVEDAPMFEEWLVLQREQLHRIALTTLHELATWYRRQGDSQQTLHFARQAVALDSLWEPGQRQLMHALWLSGERAEALSHYQVFRQLLLDELDVAPDEQTQKLFRRILADREAVSPRPAGLTNLPYPLTPFIGRERALYAVIGLLSQPDCRLLSLVGPGGSGKSRLAVEAARRLVDDFPDGIFLVPLSPVPTGAALIPVLAQTLQLPAPKQGELRAQLFAFLREKRLLLIMDSFERLVDGAGLVVEILQQAAGVKVLATSRVSLGAKGEHIYRVEGMSLPSEAGSRPPNEAESVRLFLSAAERAFPGYTVGPEEMRAVATICRLVEGMPLGIILATGWLRLYKAAAIAEQIEQSLDFLAMEWADMPRRQRSLRATLNYTWQLLDSRQQEGLAALAVFRGGFTAEAVAYVAGFDGPGLLDLLDRSIIQRAAGDRFTIHDMLAQFAGEKLAVYPQAEHDARSRHANYFTGLAAGQINDLKGSGQQAALERLEADAANLSAAWGWAARQGEAAWLDRALDGVGLFCDLLGRLQEGRQASQLAANAIAAGATSQPIRLARAKSWLARFCHLLGKDNEAQLLAAESREWMAQAIDDPENLAVEAFAWLVSGDACVQTDRHEARIWYTKSLDRYRKVGDLWGAAGAQAQLALISHHLGDIPQAMGQYEECLALYKATGDRRGVGRILAELGHNALRLGKLHEGEQFIKESVDHFERLGDRVGYARSLLNLGRVRWWLGDPDEMNRLMAMSAPIVLELGLSQDAALCLAAIAGGHCIIREYDEALASAAEAVAFARQHDFHHWVAFSMYWQGIAQIAKGNSIGAIDLLAESAAIGREIEQSHEVATSMAYLACAFLDVGKLDLAVKAMQEAMGLLDKLQGLWAAIYSLPMAALLLARLGRVEQAISVYSLIRRYPAAAGMPMLDDLAGRPIYEMAQELDPEVIVAAETSGRELDLWQAVAELVAELSFLAG